MTDQDANAFLAWVNSFESISRQAVSFNDLTDGILLGQVLNLVDPIAFARLHPFFTIDQDASTWIERFNNLTSLYSTLIEYYQNVCNYDSKVIEPPNLFNIAKNQGFEDLMKLCTYIIAASVFHPTIEIAQHNQHRISGLFSQHYEPIMRMILFAKEKLQSPSFITAFVHQEMNPQQDDLLNFMMYDELSAQRTLNAELRKQLIERELELQEAHENVEKLNTTLDIYKDNLKSARKKINEQERINTDTRQELAACLESKEKLEENLKVEQDNIKLREQAVRMEKELGSICGYIKQIESDNKKKSAKLDDLDTINMHQGFELEGYKARVGLLEQENTQFLEDKVKLEDANRNLRLYFLFSENKKYRNDVVLSLELQQLKEDLEIAYNNVKKINSEYNRLLHNRSIFDWAMKVMYALFDRESNY